MKKCSVIIPAHNEELFIEKTLKSLNKQDYKNFEIIIVDNKSNDSTCEIAKESADNVVTFNKKLNASAARNFGVKNSTGEYLAFLDADSCLSSNAISNLIKFLDNGYCGGTCRLISPEDRVISKMQTLIVNKWPRVFGPMYTPFIYTSRNYFKKTGGWNENIELADEIDFQRKLLKFGKLKFDLDSFVSTSPRRYIKKGYIRTTFFGVLGYVGYNRKWDPVRLF